MLRACLKTVAAEVRRRIGGMISPKNVRLLT
jgi:hypothetical protein